MAISHMALGPGELKNDEKRAITPRRVIRFTSKLFDYQLYCNHIFFFKNYFWKFGCASGHQRPLLAVASCCICIENIVISIIDKDKSRVN